MNQIATAKGIPDDSLRWADALVAALGKADEQSRLDIGCAAAHGLFYREDLDNYTLVPHAKAATAFLFELIARLQASATVPMIDIRAYARWLE